MKWYYTKIGGHTHVRVFMNGALCGRLSFTNAEFAEMASDLRLSNHGAAHKPLVSFIDETPPSSFEGVYNALVEYMKDIGHEH